MQTVRKLSRQRSDKGSRIYRSETNGFDSRKASERIDPSRVKTSLAARFIRSLVKIFAPLL